MPVKGDVPWSKEPHTAAKHAIYAAYLAKWFPILLSDNGFPSVTYAEGFSGPGIYADGSPGSPIIAIEALLSAPELQDSPKTTRFLFVDDDRRCTSLLRERLRATFPSRPRSTDLMPVEIRHGKCADVLEPALDEMGSWHQPILAVLDSWGNHPVSYDLMRRLAQNPGSEVIATFKPQHFIRFVDQLDERVDSVFGHNDAWRAVAKIASGQEKKQFLLGQYRDSLRRAGFRFLLDFEMVTRKGDPLYLVFATNHRRGLEKMKEAVWSVDRVYGVGFRDPNDPDEEPLFDLTDPALPPLERLLEIELRGGPRMVEDLRSYALFATVFREQHVIPALTNLLERGRIEVDRPRLQRASMVELSNVT